MDGKQSLRARLWEDGGGLGPTYLQDYLPPIPSSFPLLNLRIVSDLWLTASFLQRLRWNPLFRGEGTLRQYHAPRWTTREYQG